MNTRLGQLLESLPLAQRLLRYRQLSQEALEKATKIEDEEIRAGYLSMAAGWHMLATEIARLRDRQLSTEGSSPETSSRPEQGDREPMPGTPGGTTG